jgi:hypothetical protein
MGKGHNINDIPCREASPYGRGASLVEDKKEVETMREKVELIGLSRS